MKKTEGTFKIVFVEKQFIESPFVNRPMYDMRELNPRFYL
jgi:hypothetical protein